MAQYIWNLMDTYGGGMGVLWVAIFEMAAIMWIYGVGRFSSDLKFMLESNVSWFWKITWSAAPVILGRTEAFKASCKIIFDIFFLRTY